MANFQIGLEGKLLTAKTTENIKKSLNRISNDVNKNAKFQLIANLNSNNTKKVIQKQLNQLAPKLKLTIDTTHLEKTISKMGGVTQSSGSKTPKSKQTNVNVEELNKQFDSLNYKFNEIRNNINNSDFHISGNFSNEIDNILQHLQEFQSIATSDKKFSAFNSLQKEVMQLGNDFDTLRKKKTEAINLDLDKQKFSSRIKQWLNENTKAGESLILAMTRIQSQVEGADKLKLTSLMKEFQALDRYAKSTNQSGKSMFDNIKNRLQKFTSWFNIGNAVSEVTSQIREAVTELKEMDTILTEISKTSDMSTSELTALGTNAFDVASKYGQKASDYLLGVQEMSRSGYENPEEMAELSTLTQSAGDMTAELANQYLIATDAAYKYNGEVKKLNATLDGMNYVTNHNSVNMSDLADATSIVASQAANAGIAEDQLTAILGTMVAKSKQSGSEMANAFKAILINLQQIKGYTDEETGETFDEESFTKYENAAKALGVSFKEMKNGVLSLRDPVSILEDLSQAYSKLDSTDTKRANLLSAVGGKLRANALDVLLSNWDTYKKMLSEFSQGGGSAAEEAQKTADSWEGNLNKLTNTWTKFVNNFVDSGSAKTAISLLDGLVNTLDKFTGLTGSVGTIITAFAGIKSLKGEGRGKMIPFNKYALVDTGG
ncbi:MAG: phage tail tape measure protein, partial [Ruminococcus sp.]|nr:phage tail tape measure protein [Ruminococcus sp.]